MKKPILLTRTAFRESVFARDAHCCVICKKPAVDAHHILERRLWSDGGYYLENGASVCEEHHIAAETTLLTVEDLRVACGITRIILPEHLDSEQRYDKWGNPILPNGQRLKGELFSDESVQKILAKGDVLRDFTHWVKYPRTLHLPWSEAVNSDDRALNSLESFIGQQVVVTEKMDGENTTMYCDHIHARSVDGRHHPSRNWVKQFWASIKADIPEGWRICGENVFAKHSIHYTNLESYFLGFSIWNNQNQCLPWAESLEWFHLLGIKTVPVLYDGTFDQHIIQQLWNNKNQQHTEGYVVRLASAFSYKAFRVSVAKFVRHNHVQTSQHWVQQQTERNLLQIPQLEKTK